MNSGYDGEHLPTAEQWRRRDDYRRLPMLCSLARIFIVLIVWVSMLSLGTLVLLSLVL